MARILIVDDEATVRRIMALALEKAGFEVETAINGETALEQVRERAPDVMITDIEMPRMDGRTLCETIDSELPDRRFPIFVLTSLTEREHREWARAIRNLRFVEKPVSIRKLIARLEDYRSSEQKAVEA